MKVLLFGAGGAIGRAVAAELLGRGHAVTGVSRSGRQLADSAVPMVSGDATDPADVARLAPGHDTVVSAVGPSHAGGDEPAILVAAARGLIEGLHRTGVRRLVVCGGAGSLLAAPGVRLVDTPDFRPAWKPVALAHADALAVYRAESDLDWSYLSPAALIEPGERSGRFRLGGDEVLTDDAGNSRITIPDFAIAVVDELEQANAVRRRITVAY